MAGGVNKPRDAVNMQAVAQFGLDPGKIENTLPCTAFQRDVLDCASQDRQLAIGHVVYEIPKNVSLERLAIAWKEVVRQTPALRTRLYMSESKEHARVVLLEDFVWMSLTGLEMKEAIIEEEAAAAVPGARCNRLCRPREPRHEATTTHLDIQPCSSGQCFPGAYPGKSTHSVRRWENPAPFED